MLSVVLSFLNTLYEYLFAIYRDFLGVLLMIKTKKYLRRFDKIDTNTYKEFQKVVRYDADKPCIVFVDKSWTFKEVNYFLKRNLNLRNLFLIKLA